MSMASRYPAAWMEELRARNDIVQVISGYVGLKKSGRKYWGLCPFHGEKTASFSSVMPGVADRSRTLRGHQYICNEKTEIRLWDLFL